MPRLRASRRAGGRMWKPMVLDHDIQQRPTESFVEDEVPKEFIEPNERNDGMVVFVETFKSMAVPPPLGSYIMDIHTPHAAIVFYLKDSRDSTLNAPCLQMSKITETPHGAVSIIGSRLTMPYGPDHGQRMMYIATDRDTFTVVLWCAASANWSHVATFEEKEGVVRAYLSASDWNESAMIFVNSHETQSAALCRLYRLGKGRQLQRKELVVLPSRLDPFHKFLTARTLAVAAPISESTQGSFDTSNSDDLHGDTGSTATSTYLPTTGPQTYTESAAPYVQSQYQTPINQAPPIYYPQSQLQFGAVPWYSLPYYGAVQWPHGLTLDSYYAAQAYSHYGSSGIPPAWATTDYNPAGPVESPTVARSIIRNTVMQMPEQAKERNKHQTEYRTVLHDPFQAENNPPLRAQAPSYVLPTPATANENDVKHDNAFSPFSAIESPCNVRARQKIEVFGPSSPDNAWHATKTNVLRVHRPSRPDQYSRQHFNGPFFTDDLLSPHFNNTWKAAVTKSRDQAIDDWWWSSCDFARQEDYHRTIVAVDKTLHAAMSKTPKPQTTNAADDHKAAVMSRALVPVFENLSSYISGPVAERRDYWTQWVRAPEWCCDQTEQGSRSFLDKDWGCPPARIGRDPRYKSANHEIALNGRHARGGYVTRNFHIGRDH